MGKVNIFKIDDRNIEDFLQFVQGSYNQEIEVNGNIYDIYLYTNFISENIAKISWQWVLDKYNIVGHEYYKFPYALLYLKLNDSYYVATFGQVYQKIYKLCDKNFAFKFARKFEYELIKTTAQTNPNSNKTKVINSYIDNRYFDYDSGSAYTKVKGTLKISDDFDLFNKNLEIGTSIKLSMKQDSIENFIKIILFINDYLNETVPDKTKIPLFNLVTDNDDIERYNSILQQKINDDDISINFSDFDIVGTKEIFHSQSVKYKISYGRFHKDVIDLNKATISNFCEEKDLDFKSIFLNISIKAYTEEGFDEQYSIKDLIDFSIDEDKVVLIQGEWYEYNDDYLSYLHDSLSDLECYHDEMFDFNEIEYESYINQCYENEKCKEEYVNLEKTEVIKKLKCKYYKEKVYNEMMSSKYGFRNDDRTLQIYREHKLEVCDLFKDNKIYAVKIGNSSGKLCYVVDQSTIAIKYLKSENKAFAKSLDTICIVLIIDNKDEYPQGNNQFDITLLNYIALKNSLDTWKKDIRSLGYKVKLIIGYQM